MPSDSSEEDLERIKEAVDENFLTQDLYESDNTKEKAKSPPKRAHSIRNQNQNQETVLNNPLTLRVTPEFQKHVSKHLSKLMDKMIDDTESIDKSKIMSNCYVNPGIKLLSSSKNYLAPFKNSETFVKPKKYLKKNLSERDYKKRAKEVAVSGEWVLSQKETKYWAPNMKGEIEIVKINNCYSERFMKAKKNKK